MKKDRYEKVIDKIKAFVPENLDWISALSNISAIINEEFSFLWCGFYLVKENELLLGPFQGHPACTKIPYGKGVCGKSWQQSRTLIVYDVDTFEGYIACSSIARSEIVVPVFSGKSVVAVIDIDSDAVGCFDDIDKEYLEIIAKYVSFFFNFEM